MSRRALVIGMGVALLLAVAAGVGWRAARPASVARPVAAAPAADLIGPALGRLGRAAGDPAAARAVLGDLDRALAQDPQNPRALFAQGWAYHIAGDRVKAETRYREACLLGERSDAPQMIEIAYYCRYNLGVLYREEGHLEVAAAELREAAQVGEQHLDLLGARVGDAWLNQGRALNQLGRFTEALPALEQAARRQPASGLPRYEKGVALWRAGKREFARSELDEAVKLTPSLAGDVAALTAGSPAR